MRLHIFMITLCKLAMNQSKAYYYSYATWDKVVSVGDTKNTCDRIMDFCYGFKA